MTDSPGPTIVANAAYWDAAAARWRTLDAPPAGEVARLVAALACPPGALLLDAGCGAGRWSVALAAAGYRTRGVDLSRGMAGAAREAARGPAPDAAFAVAALDALPFPDAAFDGAICFNVLDFTPSPGAALRELWRALKPGARLIVETLGARSPVKAQTWRRFLPDADVPPIANQILPWETEALLDALGWQILGGRPLFGPAASGAANAYDAERAAALADPILQQTVATSWEIVARKPGG
jgi:SAM-dependent methyltransferase